MEPVSESQDSIQHDSAAQPAASSSNMMNPKKGNFQPRGGRNGGKNFAARGGRGGGGGMNSTNRGLKSEVS